MPQGCLYEAEVGERFNAAKMIGSSADKKTGTVQETTLVGFSLSKKQLLNSMCLNIKRLRY